MHVMFAAAPSATGQLFGVKFPIGGVPGLVDPLDQRDEPRRAPTPRNRALAPSGAQHVEGHFVVSWCDRWGAAGDVVDVGPPHVEVPRPGEPASQVGLLAPRAGRVAFRPGVVRLRERVMEEHIVEREPVAVAQGVNASWAYISRAGAGPGFA